jgi:hypothetical protein
MKWAAAYTIGLRDATMPRVRLSGGQPERAVP